MSVNLVRALEHGTRGRRARSSAWSAGTAATPTRVADESVLDPDRERRAGDPPHRGHVRRRLAPAREPSGAAGRDGEVGVAPLSDRPAEHARWLVVGGAGFIGGHFVDRLLSRSPRSKRVTVYDNFSSGREVHLERRARRPAPRGRSRRTSRTSATLIDAHGGHDVVVHLASNPDIARAATEPSIDFDEGTLLTHHVLEAMRRRGRRADPLRLGQRRLRRPRRDRGRRGLGPARPDLDLRREQARGRGADLRLQLHVRPVRARLSLRERRRAAADARRRPRLRARAARGPDATAHPRRRNAEQVLRPRRRRHRGDARGEPAQSGPYGVYNVATGDYITVDGDRRPRRRVRRPRPERACGTSTRAATAAGRATFRSCGSRSSGSAASAGRRRARRGRRCASRWPRSSRTRAPAGCDRADRAAVFLDRDGVLIRAPVVDGPPGLDPRRRGARARAGREPRPARALAGCRLRADRRHEPAGDRPRHAVARQRSSAINAAAARAAARWTRSSSARTTTRTAATCRKPKPGMLRRRRGAHGIDLEASYMVGDRWRDVEAGQTSRLHDASSSTGSTVSGARAARRRRFERSAEASPGSSRRRSDDGHRRLAPSQDLRRRRRPRARRERVPRALDQGLHDESDADARGRRRRLPDVRPGAPRARPGPPDLLRGDRRRPRARSSGRREQIASWGENVFVKVPVTNTRRETMARVARSLAGDGIKVNVTAVMTVAQVEQAASWLADGPAGFVSVFAGRIADTGRDPVPIMTAALEALAPHPNLELIWASPRELLNVVQADAIGCHVITVTDEILEAPADARPRPRRVLARHREDVPPRRRGSGVSRSSRATLARAQPRSAQRTSRIPRMSWPGLGTR